jgi:hypothetical protein
MTFAAGQSGNPNGPPEGSRILTRAIRGKATAELQIPKANYDGLAILQIIEQHAPGAPQ